MLVGVGGSGKQSLSRLASFICNLEKFQIVISAKYSINEFRVDVAQLYQKCGQKNQQYMFLITDGQIVVDEMLVYLNDLLNSGNIPDLFPPDEMEVIQSSMINEAKAQGLTDFTPAVLWQFFINKVRANLHTVLCLSPVGKQFSLWCRQFPALANTTVIDWFHRWPEQALRSVAQRFLETVDLDKFLPMIAEHMAICHQNVTQAAEDFVNEERRYCYTTPKSFLELISLYRVLLTKKRDKVGENYDRLTNGINKIELASAQVEGLQVELKRVQKEVAEKATKTEELLQRVRKEQATVAEEQEKANIEEQKTNKIMMDSEAKAAEAARDLQKAQPLVEAALAALKGLEKQDLTELKSLQKPPPDVEMVVAAVMVLTSNEKKIPPLKAREWAQSKKMMANVSAWMRDLENFDYNNIPQACVDGIKMYLDHDGFEGEKIKTKSNAAAGLCEWVRNMKAYHVLRCEVKPKEEAAEDAREKLMKAKAELKRVQDQVARLNAECAHQVDQLNRAQEERDRIVALEQKTKEKADLADRLVKGLSGERIRWGETCEELKKQNTLLIGDVLLAAAFVSYIGPFSKAFRDSIMEGLRVDIRDKEIPHTPDLDIVTDLLTSEAEVAGWQNEELKSDRLSMENGAVVVNCTRWPLLIDPQMQGVKWIRTREIKKGLKVCQASQKNYLKTVQHCLEDGLPCLIENLGEVIDPILEPVLGREVIRKGPSQKIIKLGDTEVSYNDKFSLFLQTRLNNPHYKPEINAQTTLINFMVTPEGLEDQLLSVVVDQERPDLEQQRVLLLRRMNQMTIDLQQCEEGLLEALAKADNNILEDVKLVVQLETTKKQAGEIQVSMTQAKQTQKDIKVNRETYTPVAIRGSLLFFQIDQLAKIQHMYQYSLGSYMVIFLKALSRAEQPEDAKDLQGRCQNLINSITENIFAFVSRGLFEAHKLIFSALLCFAVLRRESKIAPNQLQYLLRGPKKLGNPRPEAVSSWLTDAAWQAVQALKEVEGTNPRYENLETDLVESGRFKVWCELERPEHPEEGRLPTDWKNLDEFQKLLILRALRPDRLTVGLTNFVASSMGHFYVEDMAVLPAVSFEDSGPVTPMFFILSPGVDPVGLVVALGKKLGYTDDGGKFFNVSLGQGQEKIAWNALEQSFKNGGWAMLNNIHLVAAFCRELDKRLDTYEEIYNKVAMWEKRRREKRLAKRGVPAGNSGGAPSAEHEDEVQGEVPAEEQVEVDGEGAESAPAAGAGEEELDREGDEDAEGDAEEIPEEEEDEDDEDDAELRWDPAIEKGHKDFRVFLSAEPGLSIPIGILQRSIKLTNEPPSGIRANMIRAFKNFGHEPWENSQKPTEFKAVVFAMCFFHSIVVERKKFGPIGWNRAYPFNVGDLTTCIDVFSNYEETGGTKIPWDDLRYIYGEIMYGGHITDDWDRVLCMAYLSNFLVPQITDELDLAPGLPVPSYETYQQGAEIMKNQIPAETPMLYGLHGNAEIGYQTASANKLFSTINELQPKGSSAGVAPDEEVKERLQRLMDELPEVHNLQDISERLDVDRSPQAHVFYQECERTNLLRAKVHETLAELDLGLKGALSMSEGMQELFDCLFQDRQPPVWSKFSYMSMRPLGSWFENMKERNQQLADWTGELTTPKVVFINLFFNPMSFLTAIMQDTAIKFSFDLDQMELVSDVLKKMPDSIEYAAKDGCHVYGMIMEGGRWDQQQGSIDDSYLKDLYPRVPVVTVKSLPTAKIERKDQYLCPLYKTQARGAGIVTGLYLKSKQHHRKWTIAGVALLLDVVE